MTIVWALLFVLTVVVFWCLNLLGLPGNWMIAAVTILYAWMDPGTGNLRWGIVAAVVFLALLAEIVEFAAGAAGVKKAGGSRRGAVLALLGSVVGAMTGLSVFNPVFGSIIAALFAGLGAFVGPCGETLKAVPWKQWNGGQAAFLAASSGQLPKSASARSWSAPPSPLCLSEVRTPLDPCLAHISCSMDVADSNCLSPCLCNSLRQASRAVTGFMTRMRTVGLRTTQYSLLRYLKHSGPVRQRDFGARTSLDETTLTRNLRPLIQAGWVAVDAGADRREKLIRLTKLGLAKLAKAGPAWERAQDRLRTRLPKTAWSSLLEMLPDVTRLADEL